MPLSSFVPFDDTYQDPNNPPPQGLAAVTPPAAQFDALQRNSGAGEPTPPAAAPQPVSGVDYVPPAQAQGGQAPLYSMPADEALKLARQGAGVGRPAGWTPTTRSETLEGRAASPEYAQAVADKLAAGQDYAIAQYNADTAQGQAHAEAARRMAVIDEANRRADEQRTASTMASLARDRQHITDLMNEANKPQKDPEREYWDSRGTGGKIATVLAMMFKGFSLGLSGRGQDPGEWLNGEIQRSVQAQRDKAMQSRQSVTDATNLYQLNKAALGDDDRAALATEAAQRAQVMGQLDQRIAEATADPMAQLRMKTLQKQLADTQAQTLEQFWDKTAEKHTTSGAQAYKAAQLGGAQDPLALLQRGVAIKKAASELANDLPEKTSAQELEAKALGNRKAEAETKKLEAEAKPDTALADTGRELKSTAYKPIIRDIQGTDTNRDTLGQDAWNAAVTGAAVKKFGARGAENVIGRLRVEPGDTPATIAIKRQEALRLLGGTTGTVQGVTPGVAPDED